ncbi:hypothetical protein JCM19232_3276 [Vibrio ishigakensis]|uniref:Uncharacterized protein n=1 Tax=Vibrio ishigakensis TaxID=1481914 RepID=A0A0B8PB52_9VIBR|nr:hypothetical protein JCM19232_3276 [Vibrio ishigakensis]
MLLFTILNILPFLICTTDVISGGKDQVENTITLLKVYGF